MIVNDLDRGWLWWAGAWLMSHLLTSNRYTRHDAALSVRRAYRPRRDARVGANQPAFAGGAASRAPAAIAMRITFVRRDDHDA